jgi:hypothetical protein
MRNRLRTWEAAVISIAHSRASIAINCLRQSVNTAFYLLCLAFPLGQLDKKVDAIHRK